MNRVDCVYYINLDKRQDRKAEMETQFANMNIHATRFPAIQDNPPAIGCTKSHLNILRLAMEDNVKNILILEDDFEFDCDRATLDERLNFFLDNFPKYDVVMLTYGGLEGSPTPLGGIGKIKAAYNSAGYLVSGHYLPRLIANLEGSLDLQKRERGAHWKWAIDQFWKSLQATDEWFFFHPPLGYQRGGYSDIANRHRNASEFRKVTK